MVYILPHIKKNYFNYLLYDIDYAYRKSESYEASEYPPRRNSDHHPREKTKTVLEKTV